MRILKTLFVLVMLALFVSGIPALAKSLDAEMRHSDVRIPTTMKVGQKYDVTIKVKNSGDVRWQGRRFAMKSKILRSPSGAPAQRDELTPDIELTDVINTGATWSCHFKVEAPDWTGEYTLEYSMADGNTLFGDRVDVRINVVAD